MTASTRARPHKRRRVCVCRAVLAVCLPVAVAGAQQPDAPRGSSPDSAFAIRYQFTSETNYEYVDLSGDTLQRTSFVDQTGRCATWVEQRPCWTPADVRTVRTPLPAGERRALIRLIRRSGFFGLDTLSGAVDPDSRAYAERVEVLLGTRRHVVNYRAAPGVAPRPAAFIAVRDALLTLSRKIFSTPPGT